MNEFQQKMCLTNDEEINCRRLIRSQNCQSWKIHENEQANEKLDNKSANEKWNVDKKEKTRKKRKIERFVLEARISCTCALDRLNASLNQWIIRERTDEMSDCLISFVDDRQKIKMREHLMNYLTKKISDDKSLIESSSLYNQRKERVDAIIW